MDVMEKENHWMNLLLWQLSRLFENDRTWEQTFQPFCAEDNWDLRREERAGVLTSDQWAQKIYRRSRKWR